MGKNIKTKKISVKPENSIAKKAIILVYLLVLFVPPLGALDVMNTQWLYVALVNFGAVGYILFNPSQFDLSFHNKLSKFIFIGATIFVGIALLSFTKSMIISESVVHLTFLLNTLIAFFVFYSIVKENPKEYFEYVTLLFVIFLGIEAYQLVSYFYENNNEPRSRELVESIPHQIYGNRNILATSLVIKSFFAVFYFVKGKKLFRLIFLSVFVFGVCAIILTGARTAIYSLPILLLTLIVGYFVFLDLEKKFVFKMTRIILPVTLAFLAAGYIALSLNKIYPDQLNSISDMVFEKPKITILNLRKNQINQSENLNYNTQNIDLAGIGYFPFFDNNKTNFKAKGISNFKYFENSGREKLWISGMETLKKNKILGSGLGQWKLINKPDLIKSTIAWQGHFYPRRVHNDFLQVGYEMGLLGFIPFLGFFTIIFYLLVVGVFNGKVDEVRFKNLLLLCAFIAFSIDSFINFPAERPPIQIEAFLFLALILSLTTKAKSFRIPKFIPIVLILISGTLIYTNYQMFTSSKMDLKIRDWDKGFNMFTQKYPISYNELVAEYAGFPDLHGLGKSKELVKAKFAYSEGRYKTAMNHLNRAIKMTPYQQEHKALKAVIFELNKGMKNPDSSYHYAKMVYKERPTLINMERILKLTHKRKKDPRTIKQFLEDHRK
ncbi:MAG: hypothetical protein CMB99_02595 [Flavobacteriaceae bacterium]|nr:hypothetical protein [Flavobacteriaceae bacterium]